VPAFGSEIARMRPLGLIAVTLAGGGRGVSAVAAQTAMVMATVTRALA
jgi:hypothetical protein